MAFSKVQSIEMKTEKITGYSVIVEILLSKTIEKKKQNDN
jgi:hypothetical protein